MGNAEKNSKVLRDFWKGKIEAWEGSGKSGARWCKEHELSYYYFTHWKRILSSEKKPSESNASPDPKEHSSFTELSDSPSAIEGSGIKIQCESIILHIDRNFDPQSLGRILRLLRNSTC